MTVFRILSLCALTFCWVSLDAQQKKDFGKVSGSVEANFGVYVDDDKLTAPGNTDKFGTNTFVNLGYELKRFRFGVEYDIFEPPMIGFSSELEGNRLMQGFASYASDRFEVRLGTVFEQFGSGLLFRAYEDRSMAINTSVMGGSIKWKPWSWLSLKGVAGVPKKFLKYAKSTVYGVDGELFLHEVLTPQCDAVYSIGGSWLLRDDRSDLEYKHAPQTVRGYSGRLNFTKGIVSLGGEYVVKSHGLFISGSEGYLSKKGRALLLNGGVDVAGFGVSVEYRTIRYMEFMMEDKNEGEALMLNYIPALTQQQRYALLSLYPHEVTEGCETGGKFDIFGDIPWGKSRNSLHFALNGAMYRGLAKDGNGEYEFMKMSGDLKYAELGLELEKKWGRDWKTTLVFNWQKKDEFSRLGYGDMLMNTEAVVADVLYKLTPRHSLRLELQHAWSDSKDDQRWMYGLLEWGFAPKWMVYASDMYNYESAGDQLHYYSCGGSFTHNKIRIAVGYGRNRAGMQCSGGVCRYVPEHTGMTASLSFIL